MKGSIVVSGSFIEPARSATRTKPLRDFLPGLLRSAVSMGLPALISGLFHLISFPPSRALTSLGG